VDARPGPQDDLLGTGVADGPDQLEEPRLHDEHVIAMVAFVEQHLSCLE
jgi:hypothetical protein